MALYYDVPSLRVHYNNGSQSHSISGRARSYMSCERTSELDANFANGAPMDELFPASWLDGATSTLAALDSAARCINREIGFRRIRLVCVSSSSHCLYTSVTTSHAWLVSGVIGRAQSSERMNAAACHCSFCITRPIERYSHWCAVSGQT